MTTPITPAINGSSTNSVNAGGAAPALLYDSTKQAALNWGILGKLLALGFVVWFAASTLWGYNADRTLTENIGLGRMVSAKDLTPVGEILPMVFTMTPSPEPQIVVVTATPTAQPVIEYIEVTREVTRYVYESVPVEVTRIVERQVSAPTPLVLPSPTPLPLAPGSVEVCASVEGARALYIGGQGVVSGGCQIFQFGIGQTTIQVQINK